MNYQKFYYFLKNAGKDPSTLVFEDELTGLYNRRYLLHYFNNSVNWESIEKYPLCLLMIDADYLKRINDQYGHNAGDQALVHIAEAIKKAAPKNAVPVRYAGDNFLLLLPKRSKPDARAIAGKVLHLIREETFSPEEAGSGIPLTLSIGIASAPEDARDGKTLIHMADTAMYQAKQSGRDRSADAKGPGWTEIFPETLHRHLDSTGIAGRKEQLAEVSTALKKIAEGASRFIIVEGAPGMGKTSFLTTIQENLEKTRLRPVRVKGTIQEAFRPYYLASYVTMGLLTQLQDKGLKILESLEEDKIYRLSHIIPQLIGGPPPLPENEPRQREAVFAEFTRFVTRLAGKRPLVLLIDDFHYCDPASLHLFRMLMKAEGLLIFICATASSEKHISGESIALDLFRNAHSQELGIQTTVLTPLEEADIEDYFNMIFGGLLLPKGLSREIANVTQGNPLFLVEIIRKMISDGKIYRSKQEWSVSVPEKDYFPRSLDEIVQDKIESLDEDSRKFLDRASAFGESAFLSMLAGVSRDQDARIYDIISNAEEQGIVHAEFEENDENIRFSSKQVRDIIYNGISPEEKKLLHRQIGSYQEKLYEQNLLPSASFLAHHFTRSTDDKKARFYLEYQKTHNHRLFEEEEIELYTGEDMELFEQGETEDSGPAEGLGDTILNRESMELVPHLLRALLVSVRNTRLYPEGSKSVTSAAREVIKLLDKIFQNDAQVSITNEENRIWINSEELSDPGMRWIAGKILELWDRMEIKSLIFKKNVEETELQTVLSELARAGGKTIGPGYWESFARSRGLSGIAIRQVKYTKMPPAEEEKTPETTTPTDDDEQTGQPFPDAMPPVDQDRLSRIKKLIGTLLGTYGKLRLYPAGGPVARKAISKLAGELQIILSENRALTIARVEDTLLINGVKADTAGNEALFDSAVKLLANAGLKSLTFSREISESDLEAFFGALFRTPHEELDGSFWREFARNRQLSGIFFDRSIYDIRRVHFLAAERESSEKEYESDKAAEESGRDETEYTIQDLPGLLRDLFLEGDIERVSALLYSIIQKYSLSKPPDRTDLLESFSKILHPPHWLPTAAYIKLIADRLLIPVFEAEAEPEKAEKTAELLHDAAAQLILYSEYVPAARIFTRIQQHPQFEEAPGLETWDKPHVFGKQLDPRITDALVSDLKSAEQNRRQEACQLISTMGRGIAPLLIDFIKNEDDIHIRRLAAELLGRMDLHAIEHVKQSLISESRAEEKSRLLEVIDSVTTDLATELRYTLADTHEQVRRSAFRLARRLETPETDALLAELARSTDIDISIEAINTLGRLNVANTSGVLIEILQETKNPDVLAEVCRAMGRIGSSDFIQPLARILMLKKGLFRRRKYPSRVRIAAAYAVSRIPGEHSQILRQALKHDPDARVREAAAVLSPQQESSQG